MVRHVFPLDAASGRRAGAFVTTSDLCAGALALPLGIAIYHRRWIWDRYCKIDPRTLGLFRIVLGSLCTIDVIRRWQKARLFYSSEGVLTNHFLLYRASSRTTSLSGTPSPRRPRCT
ncbi:MAG: hypothetical protein U0441_05810 [Polyangiaceae bacterium]